MKKAFCALLIIMAFSAMPVKAFSFSNVAVAEPARQLCENNFNYTKISVSQNVAEKDSELVLQYDGMREYLKNSQKLSKIRAKISARPAKARKEVVDFGLSVGLSLEKAMSYAFPEVESGFQRLENKVYTPAKEPYIIRIENTGKIKLVDGQCGSELDKAAMYERLYKSLDAGAPYIIDIVTRPIHYNINIGELKKVSFLRSSFSTNYSSSSPERKNNIRLALKSLDGVKLCNGQVLSFNEATGQRNEQRGYKKAKIIKNGVFVEEFGGGVCQASTTVYNAAILADLEIEEVHPHSLPVSYIDPCFDAMVSGGSSDLKIKNTTGQDIYICTRADDDSCTVNIYGCKKNYEIVRKNKKTDDLLQIDTVTTTDFALFGKEKPCEGESVIINAGKPGYKAIGWLEYYDKGVLVKTKQLRENTYLPTKRVILVG